ncbi:beta-ribofuranosylaminobenzene 5'-phosphate synthase family protein [Haloglomus halophilum]|uniref:beta-ribofuranosylaminobenzene 5'-phosphate synthase family protein n=1 Tax=Haloglomus halophilum TaxID=2962672 RepID=UPI0020C95791|nr:beta-ribofuranosylaminobenzene 5'-phosphate synthase family protein [Haloglomus halophilum]
MRATVSTGARLHVGFGNLSLAHERLYGGVGLALAEPRVRLSATPAETVTCRANGDGVDTDEVRAYATTACELLDVPGAELAVEATLPRHAGLGSGTATALATLAAVARAHDRTVQPRKRAPELGRGGRSGVGVAAFERGGFVVDAGHPTERFTTRPPAQGDWTVPAVLARHTLPTEWRVVLALPDAEQGRHGSDEDDSMRAVVESADPSVADDLAALTVRRLLPAAAEGRLGAFGDAIAEFGRLNGAWYADEQGGVYRPPAGQVVEELRESPAVAGVGQSSWGPAVYALTDADRADDADRAAHAALDAVGSDGDVLVTRPRNEGAAIEVE